MPKPNPNWFSITARDNGPVEIFIFDQIGKDWFSGDGVSAKEFIDALAPHKDRDLAVRINSPGGNVFDGLAIYNALRAHKGDVETRVEALAASIASIIALAGRRVSMAESAMMMIHNVAGMVMGEAEDMRQMADVLDKTTSQLANIYAARTGKPQSEILAVMNATTWFTAAEAKDFGLVDGLTAPLKAAACFNLAGFGKVPAAVASAEALNLRQENTSLRAEVSRLRCIEVGAAIDALIANDQIPALLREKSIERVLADASYLDELKALPANPPGGEPVSPAGNLTDLSPLESALAEHKAKLNRFRNPITK